MNDQQHFEVDIDPRGGFNDVPCSPEKVRDLVMTGHIVNLDSGYITGRVRDFVCTPREIDNINNAALHAIRGGRLIDCAHVPNTVIMGTAKRGGPLYCKKILGMPFIDPWMYLHTWEGGTSVYLVSATNDDAQGSFESIELLPCAISGRPVLLVGDRVWMDPERADQSQTWDKYPCNTIPSPWRVMRHIDEVGMGEDAAVYKASYDASGNVLDPLMTVLMMLNTNGVGRSTVRFDKLNKARAKSGKVPYPPYERIDSKPYITALMTRRVRTPGEEGRQGTHASPVAHLRRGHPRTFADGRQTWIKDSLINFTDEARVKFTQRSHYAVRA